MAVVTKVVFPPPPPTSNTLTSRQRTQLLRSTKKLGRVLGITPQLIDNYASPSPTTEWSDEENFQRKRRVSIDSEASSSSSSLSTSRSRWSSRTSSRQHSRTPSPASRSSPSVSGQDFALNSVAKPLLRLAMSSPSVDTNIGSLASDFPYSSSSLSSLDDEGDDLRYTIRPTLAEPSRDSFLSVPAFNIPSNNSLRLAKMERLRRKLGDNVPIHLVFPDDEDIASESSEDYTSPDTDPTVMIHWRPLPPLPTDDLPTLRPRPNSRLSNARDSIIIQTSRQPRKIRRKPVPKFDETEVPEFITLSLEVEQRKAKERLSLILELPHEREDDSEEEDIFVTPSDGPSPISAWFSDEGENRYQNFFNCESVASD